MEDSQLNRTTRLFYKCNRCMSCCYDAHIALDPYQIARLALNLHLTTRQFIERYLGEGGLVLHSRADKSCIMLDSEGCSVYEDRPQICRTYPFKRIRGTDAEVLIRYRQLPTSTGIYETNGTVAQFLDAHDCEDFFAANDRYYQLAPSNRGSACRRGWTQTGSLFTTARAHSKAL